jgi:hypothetical protein
MPSRTESLAPATKRGNVVFHVLQDLEGENGVKPAWGKILLPNVQHAISELTMGGGERLSIRLQPEVIEVSSEKRAEPTFASADLEDGVNVGREQPAKHGVAEPSTDGQHGHTVRRGTRRRVDVCRCRDRDEPLGGRAVDGLA